MRWAFAYMQKSGGEVSERNWLRDETGGSVYLRLSTRPVEQIQRTMTDELRQQIVDGAYWLRKPGPNAQVIVAYTGAVAPEAIKAVGLMAEDRRDVGLLAVTSADRLNAGWTAAQRARERGLVHARSHIERLLADVPPHCGIVTCSTAIRQHWPGWAPSLGHRTRGLGVEHFGQTGRLADLYEHYGIDANAIIAAAQAIAPRPADPPLKGPALRRFASSSIIAAPFSAIMMVGELVLPEVIDGITEASITRRPIEADHAQPRIDHRVAHPRRGPCARCRPDGKSWCRYRRRQCSSAASSSSRTCMPGRNSTGEYCASAGCADNLARDADRVGGDAAVLRRRQIIRMDRRRGGRIGRLELERAAAGRPQIGDAGGEGRKRMQRIAELVERQRLDVILQIRRAPATDRSG